MTSVPDRARVRLTGISSRAYEHPADRSALVALRKLSGFDTLLRKLFGLFNERAFRLTYLAGAVRVSERQFPHIYELVRDGSYILDLDEVPEVYVTQNPLVNAMALGRDKPFIVITTGMVNLYDPEELRWVVGHELGHILSGHVVYRTMLLILLRLAARIAFTADHPRPRGPSSGAWRSGSASPSCPATGPGCWPGRTWTRPGGR